MEITSPSTGITINNDTITIEWVVEEGTYPIVKVEIRLDDDQWINVTGKTNYTFTGLSEGYYSVIVKVTDEVGYVAEDSIEFTVKLSRHVLPIPVEYVIGGVVGATVVGTIIVVMFRRKR